MWSLPYRKPVENGGRDGSLAGGILGRFCKVIPSLIKYWENGSNI